MFDDINIEPIYYALFTLLGAIFLLLAIAYGYLMIIGCKKLIQYANGGEYDLNSRNSKKPKPAYVHHSSSIAYYDMRVAPPQQISYV